MNFLNKYKKYFGVAIIILIVSLVCISHRTVFFSNSILSSGDWSYLHTESSDEYFSLVPGWRTYPNGFGASNLNAVFYPTNLLLGLFLQSFGFATMERIVYFFPMLLLSALGMYFLARYLVKNNMAAFLASTLYAYNSYFVVTSSSHPTIATSYALSPFVFLFFFKFFREKGYGNGVIALLFSFFMMGYEFRIFYLIGVALFLYVVIITLRALMERKYEEVYTYTKKSLFFLVGFLGLSMYWVLGIYKIGSGLDNAVFNRGLWGSQYYDIFHAMTFHYSFWNPEGFTPFEKVAVPFSYFLFPILFIFSFFIKKKSREVLFLSLLGILGILLTKQESAPFDKIYLYLFEHFPGFKAFREASKFYIYTALSYSVLSAFFIAWLWRREAQTGVQKTFKYGICILVFFVSSANIVPLFYNKTQRNFVPHEIPEEYITAKENILEKESYSRILWLPRNSRWIFWNLEHPRLSAVDLMNTEWKYYFKPEIDNVTLSIQEKVVSVLKKNFSAELFNSSAIEYVVVPLESLEENDNIFLPYGGRVDTNIREWYIEELSKIKWLERTNENFGGLAVFKNKNFKSHIYTSSGLNALWSNSTNFPSFNTNDNVYLNAKLEKEHANILDLVDRVTLPIEPEASVIEQLERNIVNEKDAKEKKRLKTDFDLYMSGYFFQDYILHIPKKGVYTIYFNQESLLAKSQSIELKIFDTVLQKQITPKFKKIEKQSGWLFFSQVELGEGDYPIELYVAGQKVEAVRSQDIVFFLENNPLQKKVPTLEYRQVSPTKYIVNVMGASDSFPLIFSETFHSGWKLYIQKNLVSKVGKHFVSEKNQGTIQNNNLEAGKFYDIFSKKSSLDTNHFIVNNFANGWWIDLSELEKDGKIEKNSDGIYNFSFTLEFEPQKYFYIGFFVSLFTFSFCILFLLYKLIFWVYNKCNKSVTSFDHNSF